VSSDDLPTLTQTSSRGEREARAELFRQCIKLSDRVLVDEEGDRSAQRLYGAPEGGNAVFVVDARGRVVFKAMIATAADAERTLEDLTSGREPHRMRLLSPGPSPR
jgi:hypothetical protein